MEDYYLGHATERIFHAVTQTHHSGKSSISTCRRGDLSQSRVRELDKQYPGAGVQGDERVWGQGLMSLAKVIVVLDKDVNVRDAKEAWWVALNHIDPERDVRFIDGTDRRARSLESRVHVRVKDGDRRDAQMEGRGFTREWPNKIEMDAATKARVDAMWREWELSSKVREGQTSPANRSSFATSTSSSSHHAVCLPFALLGVIVASYGHPVTWQTVALVVVVHGRAIVAMGFNRIADRVPRRQESENRESRAADGTAHINTAWRRRHNGG